jgi:hypothetical protein
MKKYLRTWLGGFISVYIMPFEKWHYVKDEKIKNLLINDDQKMSRIYAFICFNIVSICIINKVNVDISFIIGLLFIGILNGFASCYRYWKILKTESSSNVIYKFCWILGLILFLLFGVLLLGSEP